MKTTQQFFFLFVLILTSTQTTCLTKVTTLSKEYFVAPDGLYDNLGTSGAPTTLEGARDKIRALNPRLNGTITVYLRGGLYERSTPFVLNRQDGSTSTFPVFYRAYKDEKVRLSGGMRLDPAWFSQVTDASPIWNRLQSSAKGNLYQVDLPAHGVTDFGTLIRRGIGQQNLVSGLELAFNNDLMELARWPNRGYTSPFDGNSPAVVSGNLTPDVSGTYDFIGKQAVGPADDDYPNYRRNELVNGKQYYLYHCTYGDGDQHKYWFISQSDPAISPNCWPSEDSAWFAYSDQLYPIPLLQPLGHATGTAFIRTQPIDYSYHGFVHIPEAINNAQFRFPGARYKLWDRASDILFQGLFGVDWADDTMNGVISPDGVVQLAAAPSFGMNANQPFFALNLLEEIDIPGEWYLERSTGMLYFWPPAQLTGSEIMVSRLEESLIEVNDAKHVYFQDITFELGRADIVNVYNGDDIRFSGCTVRNAGANGIKISGTNNSVTNCQIYNIGATAITINGGDRTSLTYGNNLVSNNNIYNFGLWERTYHPGVMIHGVGNTVEHNEIHAAPHAAILIYGNEHNIRFNDIYDVVQEASDAGAIYSGRDWGYRGNNITNNFIHHVQSVFGGSHAIYLDDAVSGFTVIENILYMINGQATVNGGGRDNIFRNNILVHTNGGHTTDRRAKLFANYNFNKDRNPDSWNLLGRLNVDYNSFDDQFPILPVIDYQHGKWAEHYPLLAAIPNDWSQVNNSHWLEPEGNEFSCNIAWEVGSLLIEGTAGGSGSIAYYDSFKNNLVADPLFVDEAHQNMNLKPNSPGYTLPCFRPIPFDSIGIEKRGYSHATYLPLLIMP